MTAVAFHISGERAVEGSSSDSGSLSHISSEKALKVAVTAAAFHGRSERALKVAATAVTGAAVSGGSGK